MKTPPTGPLSHQEIQWLEDMLLEFGEDDALLSFAELEGFMTAIVSCPEIIDPGVWLRAIWGEETQFQPVWTTKKQAQRFLELCFQHYNNIARCLCNTPEKFEAVFNRVKDPLEKICVLEEWCFGYMRGVCLSDWSQLPAVFQSALETIAFFNEEDNGPELEKMTLSQLNAKAKYLNSAVIALHQYWYSVRLQSPPPNFTPVAKREPIAGRNDPCPC